MNGSSFKAHGATEPSSGKGNKTKVLEDALTDLRVSCGHLQDILDSCKNRTSASALDITHCSMASRTAEAVFITLIKRMEFLTDYFKHIRHEELLCQIMVKTLNDSLAEAFLDISLK